jgi:glutathione S-transferase
MKLYYVKGACSLAVRIIINELELKSEYESVDLRIKQTETGKDFLKINPKGAVPTLQIDGGEILTENAVILQYLADKSHAAKLFPPANDFKHYRVLEWLNFAATDLHKNFGPLFNPSLAEDTKEQVVIPLLKRKFSYIDKHLHHNNYLLGDQFTLPDAYVFVMISWGKYFKFDITEWPHLSRYFTELQQRKSIQQSLQEEFE